MTNEISSKDQIKLPEKHTIDQLKKNLQTLYQIAQNNDWPRNTTQNGYLTPDKNFHLLKLANDNWLLYKDKKDAPATPFSLNTDGNKITLIVLPSFVDQYAKQLPSDLTLISAPFSQLGQVIFSDYYLNELPNDYQALPNLITNQLINNFYTNNNE